MMDWLGRLAAQLDRTLFQLGNTNVTVISVVVFIATVVAALVVSRLARRAIRRYFARKAESGEGVAYALERLVGLFALLIGVIIGLENIGIDLTALAAFGALLTVGIGLALQGIAQNFVSGITLLLERPVQKGDFVVVGDTVGVVDEIALRATRIVTRDHVTISG